MNKLKLAGETMKEANRVIRKLREENIDVPYVNRKQVLRIITAYHKVIIQTLKREERVALNEIGSLVVKRSNRRIVHSVFVKGLRTTIKSRNVAKLIPSKVLQEAINTK